MTVTRNNQKTPKLGKKRIDLLLLERGLVESRQQAQKYILSGAVNVDRVAVRKPAELVPLDAQIELNLNPTRFVSRGGEKLNQALDDFQIDVTGLLCADIGISTGGFTDCLLQRGAAHVFGIDVGYGQVAWRIRQDQRVTLFERTNIRYFGAATLGTQVDLIVIDVSFISLRTILDPARSLLKQTGAMVALVKPQFEVGKGKVGKGGVVRDPRQHQHVLTEIKTYLETKDYDFKGTCDSPITGAKGNKEFFIYFSPRA
ncbi:TlyA family RNA methyltransferase [bacterium]|nr:TlyA family RNA methyltransferase [bacterium]